MGIKFYSLLLEKFYFIYTYNNISIKFVNIFLYIIYIIVH